MSRTWRVLPIAALALAVGFMGLAAADEHPEGEHPKGEHPKGEHPKGEHPKGEHPTGAEHPGAASPEMQAMMEAWMKAATPGEHHKHLEAYVGSWTTSGKFWIQPDVPPQESTGKSEETWIFDGRFVKQKYSGTVMDHPFEGIGFIGYNNTTQKYESFWVDSMSTMMMMMTGTCSDGGKVHNWTGTYVDPATNKQKTSRLVTRQIDANSYVMEMWDTTPDGKEFKSLEMRHTRQ